MKVLTFSRFFPKGHPKSGEQTYFVEKIWKQLGKAGINIDEWVERYVAEMKCDLGSWYEAISKHHTIRAGARWKVGDMASLRVWSGKPYHSKQIEFAQVEVKKVWPVEIRMQQTSPVIMINQILVNYETGCQLAANDGLSITDFISWFKMHPKEKGEAFSGQIICWNENINY